MIQKKFGYSTREKKVYDNVKSLDKLFNKVLPKKSICLWKNSSKVQQIELTQ